MGRTPHLVGHRSHSWRTRCRPAGVHNEWHPQGRPRAVRGGHAPLRLRDLRRVRGERHQPGLAVPAGAARDDGDPPRQHRSTHQGAVHLQRYNSQMTQSPSARRTWPLVTLVLLALSTTDQAESVWVPWSTATISYNAAVAGADAPEPPGS